MRNWSLMLGGLLVWTLHFLGVYGIASLADLSAPSTQALWRWSGAGFTAACLLAVGVLVLRTRPSAGDGGLYPQVGLGACALSVVAIVWQAVPLLVSG